MKHFYSALTLCFFSIVLHAQVATSGNWQAIGDVSLSILTNDADNGDGIGDGAIFVDGQSAVVGQGITHTFFGTMTLGETLNISTYTYNQNSSYVSFNVELFNLTDATILASTNVFLIGGNTTPNQTTFNYTATASDIGDELQVRYIRTDNGHVSRNFLIDNLNLNGTAVSINYESCSYYHAPDLPLEPSNTSNETDINLMYSRYSDDYLGTSAPSASALSAAETAYANLNINVSGIDITGNTIAPNFSNATFIRTFAQELKFNPGNTNIAEKARNTVWLVSKQFCEGTLPLDHNGYEFKKFGQSAIFLKSILTPDIKSQFEYYMYKRFNEYIHFWEANYNHAHRLANRAIDTDYIYNHANIQMAYATWFDTDEERLRYMKGFKRYLERFLSYSEGTLDGIKPDGSGYHHWNAYNNYMYAYKTVASVLYYMRDTGFEIDTESYKVFRQAVYAQYMQANDDREQALSSCGRNPHIRKNQMAREDLRRAAIAGGKILGLSTADPLLAGMYNRIYGVDSEFNYTSVAPNNEGFLQLPYSTMGVFRKDNWVVVNKGFSSYLWGAEIYVDRNRYGRYQSYGALEVLYPGDKAANGYNVETWDWNFNPGTTVIRLPWDKLHAERGRIDELQLNRFSGSLSLENKGTETFSDNYGTYGLFAMDFKEQEGLGWGATHASENHNTTFTFKKSNFYLDDMIVCLASGINNDDTAHPTVTTLYQRLDNNGSVTVNGTSYNSTGENSFSGVSNNWLINSYNTGFYIVSGTDLKIKKEVQQTPNYTQVWPVDISGNATDTYYVGYLDHGTAPNNTGYEYILKPNTTSGDMQTLHTNIQTNGKPYAVRQKDANAHILEYAPKAIWGYAFFNSTTGLNYDHVAAVDASCLVMTKYDDANKKLLLSVSNPDIGIPNKFDYNLAPTVAKQVTLHGEWAVVNGHNNASIVSANTTATVINFNTTHGASIEIQLQKIESEVCTYQTIDDNDFESGWGIWNDGGSDSRRSANDAPYALGTYCVRLRDNTSTSVMTTDNLDLSTYEELTVDFSYYARSMDGPAEDFWLQISTNGGASYTTLEEWNRDDEFVNNQRYSDQVVVPGPFTATTRLRFRCDASGNSDWVYIDDVSISGCTTSVSKSATTKAEALNDGGLVAKENSTSKKPELQNDDSDSVFRIYPNPVKDSRLHVKSYDAQDHVATSYEIINFLGQTVLKGNLKGNAIDITKLSKGTYFVRLRSNNGNMVTKKFIRQ